MKQTILTKIFNRLRANILSVFIAIVLVGTFFGIVSSAFQGPPSGCTPNSCPANPLSVDFTNSRVGIGTTSPEDKLHVDGNIIADNPIEDSHLATKWYVDQQNTTAGLTSGVLPICTEGQILQYSGGTWICAAGLGGSLGAFGPFENKNNNTEYTADTDGIVTAYRSSEGTLVVWSREEMVYNIDTLLFYPKPYGTDFTPTRHDNATNSKRNTRIFRELGKASKEV